MKRNYLLLVCVIFSIHSFTQNNNTILNYKNIANFNKISDIYTIRENASLHWFHITKSLDGINSSKKLYEDLNNYLDTAKITSKKDNNFYLKQNKTNLLDYINYLEGSDVYFFYSKSDIPFQFCVKNNNLCLLITGINAGVNFDINKTSSKKRATEIVIEKLISNYNKIEKLLNNKEIKYIAFSCVYSSQNFNTDEDYKPEAIIMISASNLINKYINKDITQDEFIEKSEFFVRDRDNDSDIKKIKIVVE